MTINGADEMFQSVGDALPTRSIIRVQEGSIE